MKNFIKQLNKRQKAGYYIFFAGWVFNLIETACFGWNLKSQSHAEDICDGISCALWCAGAIVLWHGILIKEPKNWGTRLRNAGRVLFSESYLLYSTNKKSKFLAVDNVDSDEILTLGNTMIEYINEAEQQEKAVKEVNKILGN